MVPILLMPAATRAQALPDAPAPAAPVSPRVVSPANVSPFWNRIEEFARGEQIKVNTGRRFPTHCRFAGATDDYLFCDPYDAPPGSETYRFSRTDILNVRIDHDARNSRLVFGAFIVAGGIWAGISSAKTMNDGNAVYVGFLGAGLGGLLGYPVACAMGFCPSIDLPPPPPPAGFNLPLPLIRLPRIGAVMQRAR